MEDVSRWKLDVGSIAETEFGALSQLLQKMNKTLTEARLEVRVLLLEQMVGLYREQGCYNPPERLNKNPYLFSFPEKLIESLSQIICNQNET